MENENKILKTVIDEMKKFGVQRQVDKKHKGILADEQEIVDELKLQEVIGGGGFGQVWRASWRGTPVAVKVLTGSAQNTHIAKAILQEFMAEINLLKVRKFHIEIMTVIQRGLSAHLLTPVCSGRA